MVPHVVPLLQVISPCRSCGGPLLQVHPGPGPIIPSGAETKIAGEVGLLFRRSSADCDAAVSCVSWSHECAAKQGCGLKEWLHPNRLLFLFLYYFGCIRLAQVQLSSTGAKIEATFVIPTGQPSPYCTHFSSVWKVATKIIKDETIGKT